MLVRLNKSPTLYPDFIFEPDLLSAYILAIESNNKKIIEMETKIYLGSRFKDYSVILHK